MSSSSSNRRAAAFAAAWVLASGCTREPPEPEAYYDRVIQPILTARCTKAGGGVCHVDDGQGRAHGNVDLSSFESLQRRPDLLRRFGPYPYPLLLMKAVGTRGDFELEVAGVERVPLFIRHAGGELMTPLEDSFFVLARWLEDGATRTGRPPEPPPSPIDRGPCSPDVRTDLFPQAALDAVDTSSEGYRMFNDEVWPILEAGCVGRVCHGVRDTNRVPTVELYFTCGDLEEDGNDRQRRFNYLMARTFTAEGGGGQIDLKPLVGGGYHAGGKQFTSVDDPDYVTIREWSTIDPPYPLPQDSGEPFFHANVQPVLVTRGCYLEACHSLVNFNFYKPLAGTDGAMGTRARRHNYLQARFMLGLESENPREGRLLAKNLLVGTGGIRHRGGPVLEPSGPCGLEVEAVRTDPTRRWFEEVDGACIVATWHRLERQLAIELGQLRADPGVTAVFVRRPQSPDRLVDFATYRPGADLLAIDLALDETGRVTGAASAPRSLLGSCGVAVANADVRRPDVSADGSEVLFAMRTSESEGLDVWRVGIDGSGCERLGLEGGFDSTGAPIHHFDPVRGPGGVILFASTRGDDGHNDAAARGYPSRTPRLFLPSSNVWLFAPGGTPQRLSYLNGSELTPAMLHTREAIYAVEKAAPGFYQISTRALRLDDGGGYRPQLGQRPEMGYGQVAEMRELVDFRTVFIASDPGSWFGAGTLGVQDLSLGLEELAFEGAGFFHPVTILDPGATGRPGETWTGAYRSPAPLPGGQILVAYAPGPFDPGDRTADVDYGLWVIDPDGAHAPFTLYDTPGEFDVEPSVGYSRIYVPQPNRLHHGDPLRGELVFHSIPLFAPLLNDNTRLGIQPDDRVTSVRVLEALAPPDWAETADQMPASDMRDGVYVRRRLVGAAPLLEDGSLRILVPARTPLLIELLDANGNVLDWQREEEQIGAGETQARLIAPAQFNSVCGGCHNANDGSEVNVTVGPDVVTAASTTSAAASAQAVDLYTDPAMRPPAP